MINTFLSRKNLFSSSPWERKVKRHCMKNYCLGRLILDPDIMGYNRNLTGPDRKQ